MSRSTRAPLSTIAFSTAACWTWPTWQKPPGDETEGSERRQRTAHCQPVVPAGLPGAPDLPRGRASSVLSPDYLHIFCQTSKSSHTCPGARLRLWVEG